MTQDTEVPQEPLWIVGYGSLLFKPPLHHMEEFKFKKFSGYMSGFIRRFWQSSYDNRGTPERKGRVVTVVPSEDIINNQKFRKDVLKYELQGHDASIFDDKELLDEKLSVWGCIYYIPPEHAKEVADYLDYREKDGYTTHKIEFSVVINPEEESKDKDIHAILNKLPKNKKNEPLVKSVLYMGTTENESFVGPESIEDTAKIINISEGESGPNDEYLFGIHKALETLDPLNTEQARDKYLDDLVSQLSRIRSSTEI